jgi:xylulokinase
MEHVVGVDTSTTATKAVIVDQQGAVVAEGAEGYGYDVPRSGWSEQDPELWWTATTAAIRAALRSGGVDPRSVAGVGLTGQMHGLVLLDRDHVVLRPAILWNDQRTARQCDDIRALLGAARLVEVAGNDAMTGFTAPKLLWVRDEEPEIYERITHVLLPKDHVRLQLTGDLAGDKADGSGTLLFDVAKRDWSPEMLQALNIDPAWLPPTYEGPEVTGVVSPSAAEQTGLLPGTPVVAGGGDQAANAVGVGAVDPGTMALSLGTSGVIFAPTAEPRFSAGGRAHAFCHAARDRWHLMGVMLSAAGSLRWYRDVVAPGLDFSTLTEEATVAPVGARGLWFLPYLTGERTPYPDPAIRGAFVGLDVRHERADLTRAVLEGVAFGLRDGLDLMLDAGVPAPTEIRASGGGSRSRLWRQILADVLESEIATVATAEGAAFGASLLAAVGAGWYETVQEAVAAVVSVTPVATPSDDRTRYRELHAAYRELYPALSAFHDRR